MFLDMFSLLIYIFVFRNPVYVLHNLVKTCTIFEISLQLTTFFIWWCYLRSCD